MNNQDEKHRPETEEEEDNLEQESNQNQKNDWPETLQNLRDNVNEEYKPVHVLFKVLIKIMV